VGQESQAKLCVRYTTRAPCSKLGDRLEKATLAARAANEQLSAMLERMERVRTTDMDIWMRQRDEARASTTRLNRLLNKTGKALDDRKHKLVRLARGAAGLIEELEDARIADQQPAINGNGVAKIGSHAERAPLHLS
jgi:hypothetical protein